MDQSSPISCSGCGELLALVDVVIVAREAMPAWAESFRAQETAIMHEACAPSGLPDGDWTIEAPQTLSLALVGMARAMSTGAGEASESIAALTVDPNPA